MDRPIKCREMHKQQQTISPASERKSESDTEDDDEEDLKVVLAFMALRKRCIGGDPVQEAMGKPQSSTTSWEMPFKDGNKGEAKRQKLDASSAKSKSLSRSEPLTVSSAPTLPTPQSAFASSNVGKAARTAPRIAEVSRKQTPHARLPELCAAPVQPMLPMLWISAEAQTALASSKCVGVLAKTSPHTSKPLPEAVHGKECTPENFAAHKASSLVVRMKGKGAFTAPQNVKKTFPKPTMKPKLSSISSPLLCKNATVAAAQTPEIATIAVTRAPKERVKATGNMPMGLLLGGSVAMPSLSKQNRDAFKTPPTLDKASFHTPSPKAHDGKEEDGIGGHTAAASRLSFATSSVDCKKASIGQAAGSHRTDLEVSVATSRLSFGADDAMEVGNWEWVRGTGHKDSPPGDSPQKEISRTKPNVVLEGTKVIDNGIASPLEEVPSATTATEANAQEPSAEDVPQIMAPSTLTDKAAATLHHASPSATKTGSIGGMISSLEGPRASQSKPTKDVDDEKRQLDVERALRAPAVSPAIKSTVAQTESMQRTVAQVEADSHEQVARDDDNEEIREYSAEAGGMEEEIHERDTDDGKDIMQVSTAGQVDKDSQQPHEGELIWDFVQRSGLKIDVRHFMPPSNGEGLAVWMDRVGKVTALKVFQTINECRDDPVEDETISEPVPSAPSSRRSASPSQPPPNSSWRSASPAPPSPRDIEAHSPAHVASQGDDVSLDGKPHDDETVSQSNAVEMETPRSEADARLEEELGETRLVSREQLAQNLIDEADRLQPAQSIFEEGDDVIHGRSASRHQGDESPMIAGAGMSTGLEGDDVTNESLSDHDEEGTQEGIALTQKRQGKAWMETNSIEDAAVAQEEQGVAVMQAKPIVDATLTQERQAVAAMNIEPIVVTSDPRYPSPKVAALRQLKFEDVDQEPEQVISPAQLYIQASPAHEAEKDAFDDAPEGRIEEEELPKRTEEQVPSEGTATIDEDDLEGGGVSAWFLGLERSPSPHPISTDSLIGSRSPQAGHSPIISSGHSASIPVPNARVWVSTSSQDPPGIPPAGEWPRPLSCPITTSTARGGEDIASGPLCEASSLLAQGDTFSFEGDDENRRALEAFYHVSYHDDPVDDISIRVSSPAVPFFKKASPAPADVKPIGSAAATAVVAVAVAEDDVSEDQDWEPPDGSSGSESHEDASDAGSSDDEGYHDEDDSDGEDPLHCLIPPLPPKYVLAQLGVGDGEASAPPENDTCGEDLESALKQLHDDKALREHARSMVVLQGKTRKQQLALCKTGVVPPQPQVDYERHGDKCIVM